MLDDGGIIISNMVNTEIAILSSRSTQGSTIVTCQQTVAKMIYNTSYFKDCNAGLDIMAVAKAGNTYKLTCWGCKVFVCTMRCFTKTLQLEKQQLW